MKLKRILVATDFGEAAKTVFAYGRDLARGFGARLDILHGAIETEEVRKKDDQKQDGADRRQRRVDDLRLCFGADPR